MSDLFLDFTICIVSLNLIWFLTPKLEKMITSLVNEYRITSRIKRISQASPDSYSRDDSDSEADDESIGLSKKGPMFGNNALYNKIAEMNADLIEEMKTLLLNAGIRQNGALEEFMRSKINSSIALFCIIFIYLVFADTGLPFYTSIIISGAIGIIGGHKITNMNLEMIAEKRREAIEYGIPDLVDLLVICTESGLDLTRAIRRIARELRTSNPILADELSLTSIELEMIPNHRQVFENLENRTASLSIKTLGNTLCQAIEYGASLADSLRDLAVESRQKRMFDAEGKAAQAPTLLTLPMMLFIMPCLFIVMLGPVIAGMIRSFSGGA